MQVGPADRGRRVRGVDLQPAATPVASLDQANTSGTPSDEATLGGRAGDTTSGEPTRAQRIALPATLGAVAVLGCAAVALADPGDKGVPLCWSRSVFGVDCPFCGGLRCTNSLLRGHLGAALDHNVVLAAALPVAALTWVWWMVARWRGDEFPATRIPNWVFITGAILLVAFGVVRNLSGSALSRWLHSDLYIG